MSEPKIVEAVGKARFDISRLRQAVKPEIERVRLVKRNAKGEVVEDRTVEYGVHR